MSNNLIFYKMMNETEIWKDVVGYEGLYKVSNLGNVMSLKHKIPFLMKTFQNRDGYLFVVLGICNNPPKRFSIHRLVAKAFIPNPNNYPVINHKDENPLNNNVENLEWCTQKYNVNYATAIDRRSIPVLQFDKYGNFIKEFESLLIAEKETHINISSICRVCRGQLKTAGGYLWKYKDKYRSMINTEHFTLSEFTKSKVAKDNNINNFLPLELEENAKFTLQSLEKIRQAYGKSIYITSGYRCKELNKLVGGVSNSQHTKAQAVDLKWDENLYNLIKDKFVFDQLIKENGWIHISFTKNPRNQVIE